MGKSGNVENLLESLLQKIDLIAYICNVLCGLQTIKEKGKECTLLCFRLLYGKTDAFLHWERVRWIEKLRWSVFVERHPLFVLRG